MSFHIIYIFLWSTAFLVALIIVIKKRGIYDLLNKDYLNFLFKPWKIITFLIATIGITIVAPYSGDPTWDYFDSIAISVLVFLTAPWAIGTIYRGFIGKSSLANIYAAICFALFSSSWFYDIYIFFRDGLYPSTWWSNLIISSAIYSVAGLFWNLDWESGKGAKFSFQWEDWYLHHAEFKFLKILWIMIPFMVFALYAVLWFVWEDIKAFLLHLF